MKIGFKVTGIDKAIQAVDYVQRIMMQYVAIELDWFGKTVSAEMISDHPYIDRTGQLTRSIGFTIESWTYGKAIINVFALAAYAQPVEFGTATSRPYPFFYPVFYKYLDELMRRIQAAVDKAFDEAAQIGLS